MSMLQAERPRPSYVIVKRPTIWRYVFAAAVLVSLVLIVRAFAVGKIDWSVVRHYLFDPDIISGIGNSIILTFLAMAVGIVIGLMMALMLSSSNMVLRYFARGYLYVFRSIPMLLQLLLWYNLALVFPTIGIPGLFAYNTVEVVTPFVAALLAFGIGQGAYTTEVIRSGLLAVGKGQTEAAKSIGMTSGQALRRVVLPQAMRVIIPPLGNEVIGMVKYTSLASIIQYREIIYSAQSIYYANTMVIELLMVCAAWYSVVVGLLSIAQHYLERHFNRSAVPQKIVEVTA